LVPDLGRLSISPVRPGQEPEVSALLWSVLDRFVAPCYPPEGSEEFHHYSTPEWLAAHYYTEGSFVLCARIGGSLAGVLAVRDRNHLAFLFVREEHQRKGIARQLVAAALARCLRETPEIKELTVFSAPGAIQVYIKMGFTATGAERQFNGIRFTPMRLAVSPVTVPVSESTHAPAPAPPASGPESGSPVRSSTASPAPISPASPAKGR
jgi:GNAT superfamily N-acetyltransferase